MNTKISASILNSDMANLMNEIVRAEKCGADMIHLDIMDGVFVPPITFGDYIVSCVRKYTALPFDTHLMVENPVKLIPMFAAAGSDIITIHVESDTDTAAAISLIKSYGLKAGISLKPDTSLEKILPYLESVDMVLIMTVNPGYGGQSFMEETLPKIKALRKEIIDRSLTVNIEVDGGINEITAPLVKEAGANILVAGSYLFKNTDMEKAIDTLKSNKA